jgi:conjugal transfer pilus assembly protein TraB
MLQLLRDLALKLRSDRKTQFIALCLLGAAAYMFVADGPVARRAAKPKPQVQVGANDPNERWTDLVQRFNGQLTQLQNTTGQLQEEVANQKKAMQEYEATTAEIFKKILERLEQVQSTTAAQSVTNMGPQDLGGITDTAPVSANMDELEKIEDDPSVAVQPPPQPAKQRLAAIMPGDSVRVKLLAGVNAPTDGTPYPVVLKLVGDVVGPDGNAIPLGEGRLIAAAQGSLTDSRALLRITRLSIRMPNGRRKEFPVDGWIVGEDGIRGMEGVLIDPIGKAIVGAGMAGSLAGLGQAMRVANTRNTIYGNGTSLETVDPGAIPQFAAGLGVAGAANEWQQIIRDRLRILVPVVQVLSGREATAVFSQSLAIPDLLDQVDQDPSVVYTALD